MGAMTAIKTRSSPRLSKAVTQGICLGAAIVALAFSPAAAGEGASPSLSPSPAVAVGATLPVTEAGLTTKRADFDGAEPPADVRRAADWIVASGNNRGMAFVIVEKPKALVFAFDENGKILGKAPCLVGLQPGDDSVPGVGTMTLAQIKPDMRTTPAGRFVAGLGRDLTKNDVLWVDYPDAISLHRVINTVPAERRPERLASPTPLDNRISWGCINVPKTFFDKVIEPTFTGTSGVVYILPEIKTMREVFPTYTDVDEPSPLQNVNVTEPRPEDGSAKDPGTGGSETLSGN